MARIENTLSPLVYWAQNTKEIFLKIDLSDVVKPKIVLTEKVLEFEAEGLGACGKNVYRFNLRFYERIEPKRSSWKVHDSRIEIQLRKCGQTGAESDKNFWPRLISQPQKPHWLKIDFNRWISNEPVEEDNYDLNKSENGSRSKRSIMEDYPDVLKQLHQQEFGYIKQKAKTVYLVLYNLFQYMGFLYLAIVMGILYFRDGNQEIRQIYISFNNVIKFMHFMQYMGMLHTLLKFTTDSFMYPFLHITLRIFIIFGVVEQNRKVQEDAIIYILYFHWFVIELLRYSYNMVQLLKIEFKLLVNFKNNIWKTLYAVEIILSGFIILVYNPNIKNLLNISHVSEIISEIPLSMKIYAFLLVFIGTYFTMRHIGKRRSIQNKIPSNQKKKKDKIK